MLATRDCEQIMRDLIDSDNKVKTLLSNSSNIQYNCRECSQDGVEGKARAILSDFPFEIVLCSNRLQTKEAIREAFVHELIHAYDYSRNRYDFSTCDGLAASEVRAAREAECEKFVNSKYIPRIAKDECVKWYSVRSTENLFAMEGKECVKRVFQAAIKDLEPT